LRMQKYRLIFN